jgi:hypothetical protein
MKEQEKYNNRKEKQNGCLSLALTFLFFVCLFLGFMLYSLSTAAMFPSKKPTPKPVSTKVEQALVDKGNKTTSQKMVKVTGKVSVAVE